MATLADIERRTKHYADIRAALAELVQSLNDGIEALKRQHLASIKRAVGAAAKAEAELRALVEEAPDLFVKPRTVIFHGVKIGYQKGKGGIEWDDPDRVVALIRKHLPEDQAALLIRSKETPIKDALADLSVADLKRIGCSVVDAGDEIVIRPVDSTVDKMVTALLKDALEQEGAA